VGHVPETQLSTDQLMSELSSVDSEVTFRKVMGSGAGLSH